MRRSKIFFKLSDLTLHFPRNYKRYQDVTRINDIVYDDKYGKYTKGDIYFNQKKKRDKYPVFLNVHGGGFVRGDKRHRSSFSASIANRGWFVFNINHRLAPEYPLPAGIEDTLNALNFLYTLKDTYDLDLNKIVISGDSAGAYYAVAAVAAINDESMRKALNLPIFQGNLASLVTFCGLFDIKSSLCKDSPLDMSRDIAECILGIKIKKDFSNIDEFPYIDYISPIDHVNSKWPSTYIVLAKNDSFCGGQGELLEATLKEKGVKVDTYIADKYNEIHCFHLFPFLKATKECMSEVNKYLDIVAQS